MRTYLEDVTHDVRYCIRRLIRKPVFTLTLILTLGLSIGVNVAVFSLVSSLLVNGLPYKNGDRLVLLSHLPISDFEDSVAAFDSWKSESNLLEDAALYDVGQSTLLGGLAPQQLDVSNVTANFFEVLGVSPVAGRGFLQDEQGPGRTNVVVISEGLWRSQFGGDVAALGKTVVLNGRGHLLVGVVPANGRFPSGVDAWTPTAHVADVRKASNATGLYILGRIRPFATIAQADAQQHAWMHAHHLDKNDDGGIPDWLQAAATPVVQSLQSGLTGSLKRPVLLLFGAVILVLLIGCTNVANLVLADSNVRDHEFTIRQAVGMTAGRLLRQLITEQLLTGILGGLVGLGMAYLSLPYLKTYLPKYWPEFATVLIDSRVLIFAFLISLLIGVIMGLAPVWRLAKRLGALAQGSRASEGPARRLSRELLVLLETSMALVLLVSAALFIQTFRNLLATDYGFKPQNVLSVSIWRPRTTPQETAASRMFYAEIFSRLPLLGGVQAVGGVDYLPIRPGTTNYFQEATTIPPQSDRPAIVVSSLVIAPGYFRAMEVPLLEGRGFDDHDDQSHERVAIIDRTVANQLWPGLNPIGRQISLADSGVVRVVGISGNIRLFGPGSMSIPEVYRPLAQSQPPRVFSFVLRATSGTESRNLAQEMRSVIRTVDANQPADVATMDSYISEQLQRPRGIMALLTVLSGVGLVLAVVGLYGLVSYSVTSRMREFGIRIALGESSGSIFLRSLSGAMRAVLPGVLLGILLSLVASRLLQSELFGVKATDAFTFVAITLLLVCTALLASAIAARPATAVDPVNALREQ
jgi:putative ABC transport system permease protein